MPKPFKIFLVVWSSLTILAFLSTSAPAWNPDYAVNLPQQRRMCAERDSENSVRFSSILAEEDCPVGSYRYLVIFAREPKGAIALLRLQSSKEFYPPLTLTWPPEELFGSYNLWHFTCVKRSENEVLGSTVDLLEYRGEITADSKTDCAKAQAEALHYCQEKYKGDFFLEECPLSW